VAQIRQAALKAKIPLNLVDDFLDCVTVADQDIDDYIHYAGSILEWENPFSIKSQESIEHDHDDLAIAAFLAQAAKAIEDVYAKAVAEDAAEALIAAEAEHFLDQ
jgi:hypothetical protein